ncbi:hypothetical protein QBC35DRAFT_476314 [Podospora australis]|uniref:Ecp2 effector protein domain-containing protein n=1 Tax=Podospora australis TaxID=1536484 RepID=A0AAN7AFM6_9PEZI|nr:hypothetical protein QBC35DRAFT_476314 [Podospora australis]
MLFSTLTTLLALTSATLASAIPAALDNTDIADSSEVDDTITTTPFLTKRDWFDHKGSGMCKSMNVRACDIAVNDRIIRNNDLNYGAPGSGRPHTGACSANFASTGCGVFIQGKSHCARTGNQIWHDYQEIRNNGAKKCGSKHWGDGCMTTINYVTGC